MSKFIAIGKLQRRLAIQTYIEEPTGDHSTTKTWNTVANVWGDIEPVKGNVYFNSKQIGKNITHKIIIRYYSQQEITTENWILHQGKRYRIRTVRNLQEDRRYLELMCEEDSKNLDYFEAGDESAGDLLVDVMNT